MRPTSPRLLLAAAILLPAAAQAQVSIYGWQTTAFPGSLIRWQPNPAQGTVRIGASNDLSFDPAFSPAGVLWGVNGSDLFTINTATGATGAHVPIVSHIFGLNEFLIGLAFSPSGMMYSWSLNNTTSGIYTLNPANGTAETITQSTADTIFGMTFGPDGSLYASNGFSLLKLDPGSGAVLQTLGSFTPFITSLCFGPDGVLRGLSPHLQTSGTDLYRISPVNAGVTFLGSSVEDIYGCPTIPAPAGLLLLLGLPIARRRR